MKNWTSMLIALMLTAALCFGAAAGMAEGVLTLPSAVREIQAEAFAGAEGFAEIILPEGVEKIGERAFAESSIERIRIPDGVADIGTGAFYNCVDLVSADVSDGVTEITDYLFWRCLKLEQVDIPAGVTRIGEHAFSACIALPEIEIPDGVTEIGEYAFSECAALTRVTVPGSVKSIGQMAFYSCLDLETVVLKDGVESIANNAFFYCPYLTRVEIPASVTSIGMSAFGDCDELMIYGETGSYAQTYAMEHGIPFISEAEAAYEYVIVSGGAKVTGYTGSDVNVVIPEMLGGYPVTAMERTFDSNRTIETVVLPSTLKTLGGYTFWGCESLRSVTFNSEITEIGEYAFFQCRVLADFMLPTSVKKIGTAAFSGCHALTKLPFSGHVQTIGNYAFEECWGFTGVDIPDGVKTIGAGAFSNGQFLTNIVIPASVTSIGANAFSGSIYGLEIYGYTGSAAETYATNNSIPFVALDSSEATPDEPDDPEIEETPASSFNYTISDGEATILQFIGSETQVVVPAKIEDCPVTRVNSGAFYGAAVTSVVFPESVWEIGEYCFSLCDNLESVTITAVTETIGANILNECPKASIIGVENSYAHLYAQRWNIPFTANGSLPARTSDYYLTTDGTEATVLFYTGSMTDLVIPEVIDGYTITGIGNYAFTDVNGLTKVTLPSTLKVIGKHAFSYTSLQEIEIPDGVFNIGPNAFRECYSLTKATIPASVTNITSSAFRDCGDGFTIYGYTGSAAEKYATEENYLFVALDGGETPDDPEIEETPAESFEYTIADGAVTITGFIGSETDVVVPREIEGDPVTSIGNSAFFYTDVKSIVLPDSVTTLEGYNFTWCAQLETITIPSSVTNIGNCPFLQSNSALVIIGEAGSAAEAAAQKYAVDFKDAATGDLTYNDDYGYEIADGQATVTAYSGTETVLMVPSELGGYPVTAIGSNALMNDSDVTSITIPEGVTSIGVCAMQYNYSLTEVDLPESLTRIGAYTFRECESLKEITIPKGVTSIGQSAFEATAESFTIHGYTGSYAQTYAAENNIPFVALDGEPDEPQDPEGEQTEGSYTYTVTDGKATIVGYAGSEMEVTIPAALGGYPVETIGEYAFEAKAMTAVIIPDSVTTIESAAFYWCRSLQAVSIPANVTSIGTSAFSNAHTDLIFTGVRDSAAQTYAWENAIGFADAQTGTVLFDNDFAYTLENGVATLTLYTGDDSELVVPAEYDGYPVGALRWGVLQQSDTLTKVTFEAQVPSIPRAAFQNCDLLVEVRLPDSVTSIAASAFKWCYALRDVYIPASVTSIDATAFDECPSTLTIHGEAGSYAETYAAENGILFEAVEAEEPEYTYSISYDFMAVITGYTGEDNKLVLPSELGGYPVGYIGDYAFENRTTLLEVTLPATLKRIGTGAFSGCTSLWDVAIPQGVTEICDSAFYGCTGMTGTELPDSVTSIGGFAYYGCSHLKKAIIPESVTSIGARAFHECAETFAIHGYAGSEAQTYAQANGHKFVELDREIDTTGFVYDIEYSEAKITDYNGSETGTLYIPSELEGYPVTSVGRGAFYGCQAESIVVPECMSKLWSYSFAGCENLKSINIPASVTAIGECAFLGCSSELIVTGTSGSAIEAYAKKYGVGFKDAATGEVLFDNDYGYEIVNGEATIYAYTGLESELTLPNTLEGCPVTVLGDCALKNNERLTSVVIPAGVKAIGAEVLQYCYNLTHVEIPEGVERIGAYAFVGMDSLMAVTVPASVTEISLGAFTEAAEGFTMYGYTGSAAQTYASENSITFVALDGEATPDEPSDPEIEETPATSFRYYVEEDSVTILGFIGEETDIVIPKEIEGKPVTGVLSLYGSSAELRSVVFQEGVRLIGKYCFSGCETVESVTIPATLESIGANILNGCEKAAIIGAENSYAHLYAQRWNIPFEANGSLPARASEYYITTDGTEAMVLFYSGSMTDLVIPETIDGYTVTEIGRNAFTGVNGLTKVILPSTLKVIGIDAFSFTDLTEIEIPDGVTEICGSAFEECKSLIKATIPASVESISYNVFMDGSESLAIYGYNGSAAQTYATENGIRFVSLDGESTPGEATPSEPETEETPASSFAYTIVNEAVTINSFIGNETEVVVPAKIEGCPVTVIGMGAFNGNEGLMSVVISEGVTKLDISAFANCIRLKSVSLPDSLVRIESNAFGYCSALEQVVIPENVVYVGQYVFADADALTSVTIPASVTTIGDKVFINSENVTIHGVENSCAHLYARKYELPFVATGTQTVLHSDFHYTIENGECTITLYADNAASLVVPDTLGGCPVTTVGEYAFGDCDVLESIVLPSTVRTIERYAFVESTKLSEIVFPQGLESIGSRAFEDCAFVSLTIPGTVSHMDKLAFYSCEDLRNLSIEEGITAINDGVFIGCTGLEAVTLPKSLTSIGSTAFDGCSENLTIYGYTGSAAETYASENSITFVALDGGETDEPLTEGKYTYTVENGTATVVAYAGGDVEAVIPQTLGGYPVTAIGAHAFEGDTVLMDVTIPEGVSAIGEYAFASCTALNGVHLPVSLESVGAHAFDGCSTLNFVEFEKNVTFVGEDAFANCGEYIFFRAYQGTAPADYADAHGIFYEYNYDELYDGGYVYNVLYGEEAAVVGYTGSASDLVIPATLGGYPVTMIAPEAFQSRMDITSVVFPEGLTLIATNAFAYCENLSSVSFPSTLIEFYGSAFAGTALTEITLPQNMDSIGFYAFEGCKQLTKVTVLSRDVTFERLVFSNGNENLTIYGYTGSTAEAHAAAQGIAFAALDGENTPSEPEEPEIEETPASSFNYTISDGEATILQFIGSETQVVVPAKIEDCPVTRVNSGAFYGAAVTSVAFPESVWEIGEYCFSLCESLESVTITAATETIGANILNSCDKASIIGVENSYAHLYAQRWNIPFTANGSLPARTSDYYLTTDGTEATVLFYTGSMTDLVIPDVIDGYTITGIGNYAFTDVNGLTKVTLPSTLKVIGKHAFSYTGLQEIEIPDGVFSIGSGAFKECWSLTKATIPASVTNIANNALNDCGDGFTIYGYTGSAAETYAAAQSIPFVALDAEATPDEPEQETTPGEATPSEPEIEETPASSFEYTIANDEVTITNFTGSETDVVIPASIEGYPVTTIANLAFFAKEEIVSVIVPDSVVSLERQCFNYCSNLKNVILPASVTAFDDDVFRACSSELIITGSQDSAAQAHALAYGVGFRDAATGEVLFDNDYGYTIMDGEVRINAYTGSDSHVIVPSEIEGYPVVELGGGAMLNNYNLISITVPASVEIINGGMAQYCYNLKEVNLSEGLLYIYDAAFRGCESLTKIVIPNGVTYIDSRAFSGCSALTTAVIPESVTYIGEDAFADTAEGFTIYGASYSCAQTYADENGIMFIALESGDETPEDSFTYTIEEGEAVITGFVGEETSVVIPRGIEGYPVRRIGSNAFSGCTELTSVTLQGLIREIGEFAFSGTAIKRIDIPAGVTSIGASAFEGCTKLTDVNFSGGTKVLGDRAFANCTILQSLVLPDGMKQIGAQVFSGCVVLTGVAIPRSVTSIGEDAFTDTPEDLTVYGYIGSEAWSYAAVNNIWFVALDMQAPEIEETPASSFIYTVENEEVTISQFIGSETSVTIPVLIEGYPVVAIGSNAFSGCSGLTAVGLHASIREIDEGAFASTAIENISIPASIEKIGAGIFENCAKLANVYLHQGTVEIGERAFMGCASLKYITIPNTLTQIGRQAFSGCSALTYIEIPQSVVNVGELAFEGCSNLKIYGVSGTAAETAAAAHGLVFVPTDYALPSAFYYDIVDEEVYITQYVAEAVAEEVRIPPQIDGYPVVAVSGFYDEDVTRVELPPSVRTIGHSAFQYCKNMQSILIPEGVKEILDWAFLECTALTSVELPAGVETIGYWAFNGCTALKEVILNEGLISIDSEAFCDCEKLTEVVIPEGTQQLGWGVFYGCTALEKLTIPASVTQIDGALIGSRERLHGMQIIGVPGTAAEVYAKEYAHPFVLADGTVYFDYDYGFMVLDCEAMITAFDGLDTEISVPLEMEGYPVTQIGDYVFRGSNITAVTVGEGVRRIRSYAFRECENLVCVTLPSTLEDLWSGVFANCTSLREIVLPEGLCDLGRTGYSSNGDYGVFEGCTALESVVLPQSLDALGPDAFERCTSLVSVRIPPQTTRIYEGAFNGCTALERIYVPKSVYEFACADGALNADVFAGCSAVIDTEYGAPAITHAQHFGNTYFYLSLTDEVLPSKEHWIGDDYSYSGVIRCSDPISYTQMKVTNVQTGEVVLSASAEGMDTETYRFAAMAKAGASFEELDLGNYTYMLYAIAQTDRGEEAEMLCEYAFEVVPAPFRYKLIDGYQLPSSIHVYGSAYTAAGTLRTNYDMESVQVTVEHVKSGTVYSGPVLTPNARTADMAALHEGLDFSVLGAGTYEYVIKVCCNGKNRRVSPYSFVVARYDGAMDEAQARALLNYCAVHENRNVFDYKDYRDILDNIGGLEQLGMALSSRTDIFYEEIKANILGKNEGYATSLYKKEIFNLLDRMDKNTNLLNSDAEIVISKLLYDALSVNTNLQIQGFKYEIKKVKESYRAALVEKYGKQLSGDELKEIVDLRYKYGDDCLEHVSEFLETLGTGMDVMEYSLDFIEVICASVNDYQNMMLILDSLKDGYGAVPDAFAVALEEVREEYKSGFSAALYKARDKIIKELSKAGIKLLTKETFKLAGIPGTATYKLVDFVITLGLKVSGFEELSDNYFTFVTRTELALQSKEAYCNLFDRVAGGDASFDTLTQLSMMFEAAKSAFDGLYDTMIKEFNDYPEIYIWMDNRDGISKLTMP